MDLIKLSHKELSLQVKNRKISAREVAQFFKERIQKFDSRLNSFLAINENVVTEAEALDQRLARGEDLGPLAGVPFGIKDMFCTQGLPTTAGSKILQNFKPPYDATVVARLKKAGALVLGKLNQDEFAMGSSNENSAYGPVKNPWNLECVPGGSSGGSAAAVAARLVLSSVGTDTGGSVRQPASFCGIVGLKPTYGRVSRYGIVSYASSLDQAGPMTLTVEDAALQLQVIAGHDPLDSTSSQKSVPNYTGDIKKDVKGLKVGLLKEYMQAEALHPDVLASLMRAKSELEKAGAQCVELSVPLTQHAVPVYYLVATSEASSNLAKYDGVKFGHRAEFKNLSHLSLDEFYKKTRGEGFGKEVKRRILLGTYCLSSGYYDAYYKKAAQVRRLIQSDFQKCFSSCDVILSPVTTSPAFKMGSRVYDPLTMYLNDIYTVSTNLAGLPGLSIPYDLSREGLPIGLQLQGPHFAEQSLLNVGSFLETTSQMTGKVPHGF